MPDTNTGCGELNKQTIVKQIFTVVVHRILWIYFKFKKYSCEPPSRRKDWSQPCGPLQCTVLPTNTEFLLLHIYLMNKNTHNLKNNK